MNEQKVKIDKALNGKYKYTHTHTIDAQSDPHSHEKANTIVYKREHIRYTQYDGDTGQTKVDI